MKRTIAEVGLSRLYPTIASSGHSESRQQEDALKAFNSDLLVDVGLQSDVINISFLNRDAKVAHGTVQALLDQFYALEANVYANPQLQFAEEEAKRAQQKLAAAQSALTQFKAGHQIADLSGQVGQLLQQRTDVESRLQQAQGRVLEAEQREVALKALLSAVPQTLTTSAAGETYRGVDDVGTSDRCAEGQAQPDGRQLCAGQRGIPSARCQYRLPGGICPRQPGRGAQPQRIATEHGL